jgi:dienelactone hydrolase
MVHGLDDAIVGRQPGVMVGQHLPAAVVACALGLAAVVLFRRARPGIRAALALTLGLLALANGIQHVIHIGLDGPARSDLTGALAAVAGVVLVGLGLVLPFRHRGERARTAGRRWRNRAAAVVGGVLTASLLVLPSVVAITQTHKYREPIGAPPSGAYRPVSFRSTDGLTLRGWFVPGNNRAAVVLVHGGGGDRTGPLSHAQLLARHGYGVLTYDARGRGESDGAPNAYGWGWEKDVAGAIDFLQRRPEVDDERIGGLGLSTGADVLIEAAAHDRRLKAVVSDGATARHVHDLLPGQTLAKLQFWWTFQAVDLLSPDEPEEPLRELVGRVAPTPLLLIAAGRFPTERDFNLAYAEAAGENAEFWDAGGVHHTAAVRERPSEYKKRVIGLLDRALLGGR